MIERKSSFSKKKERILCASILSLCIIGNGSACLGKTITNHTDKNSIGYSMGRNHEEVWNEDVVVDVSGTGTIDGKSPNNVTGIYMLYGSQLTINGDLKLTVKNNMPALRAYHGGSDSAHYYMSGAYAGYGGKQRSGTYGSTTFTVNGTVDMDVMGTALQANKDGLIKVKGGKIITHELTSSDTYALLAEEGSIFMNTSDTGTAPGDEAVEVHGNLGLVNKNYGLRKNPGEHGSFISLALTTGSSSLTGGILNEFAESGSNPHDSGIDIYLKNGAVWKNQWLGAERAAVDNSILDAAKDEQRADPSSYLYTGSKVRNLIGGTSASQRGIIQQKDSRPITIDNYSGHELVYYEHTADGNIVGGDFIIKHAASESQITICTDNTGLDTSSGKAADQEKVNETLNALANKLYYLAYKDGETNLSGKAEISEGLTSPSASLKIGDITYKKESGQGEYRHSAMTYGDKETQMVKGAKSAMLSSAILWRKNNNDVQRRLGDLRLHTEPNGIWAKYLGSETGMDRQNVHINQRYNAVQAGYDRKVGDWTIGAALDYGTASTTYSNGSGKEKLLGIALYGSLQKEDGQYLDLIGKESRIQNDYTVYNERGHILDGDYKTHGTSLSAEYGRRFRHKDGFYTDPSIELTISHLAGKDYDAINRFNGKALHVQQSGFTSTIGRLGISIGQETEKSTLFAKIALAHEFRGKARSSFHAAGEPTSEAEVSLKDTWLDAEIGGSWQVNESTYLYGAFTKNFGATVNNKWRVDAGVHFSF